MARDSLTGCVKITRRKPAATDDHIEGSILPQGSGDGQSPEEPRDVYQERMDLFDCVTRVPINGPKARRKVSFSDHTTKNCEECWGSHAE